MSQNKDCATSQKLVKRLTKQPLYSQSFNKTTLIPRPEKGVYFDYIVRLDNYYLKDSPTDENCPEQNSYAILNTIKKGASKWHI